MKDVESPVNTRNATSKVGSIRPRADSIPEQPMQEQFRQGTASRHSSEPDPDIPTPGISPEE
jgi:hypothetical protein